MSPENFNSFAPIETLPTLDHAKALAEQVLQTFYPRGVWFGGYPRTAWVKLAVVCGLPLAIISPKGVAVGQVDEYCGRIRVSSPLRGCVPVEIWKPYGDWVADNLHITALGRPIAPVLHLKNGVSLNEDRFSRGSLEMVGVFVGGCSGIRTQTTRDTAFTVSR